MPFIPDVIPDDVPEDIRHSYFLSVLYRHEKSNYEARQERKKATAEKNFKAWIEKKIARAEKTRIALENRREKDKERQRQNYAPASGKTGMTKSEWAVFTGNRKVFMRLSREYFDLPTPNERKRIDERNRITKVLENRAAKREAEAAKAAAREKKRAAAAAAKAASKAKYEADQVYFRENRAAIKEAARQRRNLARPMQVALAAGFFTVEAYKKHIAEKPHPLAKPPEQQAERRRIRDQWRNYRAQVKAGMSANGGRIPRGFIDKQWEMQGGHCLLCDKPLDKDNFEIDHIIPVSRGGANIPLNLQLTHPLCNQRKNDRVFGVDVDHSFFIT